MGTTQRIKTEIGINKRIDIELEQDFDFLEILSLKIQQEEIYTKSCSDYGVIVGRVTANNGYGIPNARVSVFIPITDIDKSNPLITSIYPYTVPDEKNEDGYRYNLLPYEQSHLGHTPTGTFPSRRDALTDKTAIEIYDKYYKFVVKTNDSGDYMIMGAPLGISLVFVDLDLSDMGEFSLTPQDLIRMGRATESQVNGAKFIASTNLNSLPQIVSLTKSIDVAPLWGDPETCQIAISRCDFDLRDELNIDIQPTGVFMGSMTSTLDQNFINQRCKPRKALGEMCSLVAGPGQIVCIRQTINVDNQGRPILEEFKFPGGNDVIESDGSWLVDLPMNLDYIVTNEFGEKVISDDPKIGIPTKGKYRFKIKWKQPDDLGQQIKRAYYLVPNVSEYGWDYGSDPADLDPSQPAQKPFYDECHKSYSFSLDWNEYGDTGTTRGNTIIQRAIDCEDKFYEFRYNQVYTVSQLIDLYQKGTNRRRFIGIKDIQNQSCESSSYKFPMNDGVRGVDILFTLFNFILGIFTTPILQLVPMLHLLRLMWPLQKVLIVIVFTVILGIVWLLCQTVNVISFGLADLNCPRPKSPGEIWRRVGNPFSNMKLPMITYPECEMCECTPDVIEGDSQAEEFFKESYASASQSCTIDTQSAVGFANVADTQYCKDDPLLLGEGSAPCNELLRDTNNPDLVLQLMQQNLSGSMKETYSKRTPNLVSNSTAPNGFFSQDLTLSERLNLFNLKGKYFDNLGGQGGGWNQIKVSINPTQNPGKSHNDNVIALLIDSACADNFPAGGLISFCNPLNTYDVNVLSGKTITYVDRDSNVVTTNAITGTATNNGFVTIKYADPTNSNNSTPLTQTYSVNQDSAVDFDTNDIVGYQTGEYGDDTNTVFSLTLNTLLLKGTLVVYVPTISGVTETFTDNSDGTLTSNLGGTGTVEYNSGNIFLNFDAAPLDNNQILANYTEFVPATMGTKSFVIHKFPTDIEYFQVITATTYGSFVTQNPPIPGGEYNNPATAFFNSLKYRYTDNFQTVWSKKFTTTLGFRDGEYYDTDDTFRPIYTMPDQKEFIVVFLMRGVDPYSARVPMDIDISRLMGQNYGTNVVSGDYKMNIPVQPGLKLPRHNRITSPNIQNEGGYIFYPSYCYNTSSDFSGFTTYNTSNYSSLDGSSVNQFRIVTSKSNTELSSNRVSLSSGYLGVETSNVVSFFAYPRLGTSLPPSQVGFVNSGAYGSSVNPTNYLVLTDNGLAKQHRGYYTNEYIEGGSYVYLNQSSKTSGFIVTIGGTVNYPVINQDDYYYYSPVYATGATPTRFTNAETRLVMRCDRLPSSSNRTDGYENNTFVLHQNTSFAIYGVTDNGESIIGVSQQQLTGYNSGDNQEDEPSEFENSLQSSFSCSGIVPLKCYQGSGGNFLLAPKTDKCYDRVLAENGCYVLLRGVPFFTLARDFRTFAEWLSRFRVMMAACRGIFSHNFVNNWINGTLFFYTFKNNRFFRNAGAGRNQPYNRYCRDTIILHNWTSNFYYRSTPTKINSSTGVIKFVGKPATAQGDSTKPRKNGRNSVQLQYPTTVMNLGPRDEFAYQLTLSADYYGYNVDKVEQTSYKEFENILNLFIISRLRSSSFFSNLTRTGSGSVNQFFSRKNTRFDGDYAQSISINSEHGIDEFDFDSYDYSTGSTTGGNTYYIGNKVFGIFFSSDTQTRDYVTPRRIIRDDLSSPAQYDNLGFKSQVVPFYKWRINNPSNNTNPLIFGDEKNDWQTGLKDIIQNTNYQSLDRADVRSFYFMGQTAINEYYKGFIYNVTPNSLGGYDFNPLITGTIPNPNLKYLVGAPFHFYFGLTRGNNALDKFRVKFLGVETI